ncbi:hypothetical protein SMACR_04206 [Sordaria macrospora]|nr:hypothetical protein SMACR_04206 [Sordaria macrospora]WPJ65052.1 hypothetical protein SMAC4_04206 [Sordaria macrospora]
MTMKGTANPAEVITQDRLDWQQKAKTLIWPQSIIRHRTDPAQLLPDQESNQVEAIECALYYCVKQITTANVTSGRYFEESIEDTPFVRDSESWIFDLDGDTLQGLSNLTAAQNDSIAFHPRLSRFPRTDLSLRLNLDNHHNVYISQVAVDGISAFMQRTFSTCVSPLTNCSDSDAGGMDPKDFEAAAVSLSDNWKPINGYYDFRPNWFSPSIARVFWETDDLKQKWASIAQGLTNGIRRGADNLTDAFEYGADKPVFGGINEVRSVTARFWAQAGLGQKKSIWINQ